VTSPHPPPPWQPQWSLGDRLRKVRRELQWSQEELANAIGVKPTTLGAWESGRNSPDDPVYLARKIEIITGVPAAWLLGVHERTAEMEQVSPPTQPMRAVPPTGESRSSRSVPCR
jgi:transcriptional regulator with XRE-family HTH domain